MSKLLSVKLSDNHFMPMLGFGTSASNKVTYWIGGGGIADLVPDNYQPLYSLGNSGRPHISVFKILPSRLGYRSPN
jgi:hypothetical protein